MQKKERTIESQITEQKGQIRQAGVLVKEYVDDGYSGARLDRPALDELRRDVKTPLFDSIYFLNTLPPGRARENKQPMDARSLPLASLGDHLHKPVEVERPGNDLLADDKTGRPTDVERHGEGQICFFFLLDLRGSHVLLEPADIKPH
ncbi:MAG: recombinase family protein [Acetobacteraceae bacterium]|nr:recombinase family protein [Acetobacteraceae bacterium]